MRPVQIGETWGRLFANFILKITGQDATMACQDDQLCVGLQAIIIGAIHGVQYLWDEILFIDDWGF